MTEEQAYLRDSEWASIEGKLCLATAFVPMSGSIVNGAVVALDQTTPYASVRLKLADYDGDIIGYITNKLDFAMLWAAFNDNALALDGVHREPSLPGFSNLSKLPHEIWLVWTRKRYSWPANWLPKAALSKLIVRQSELQSGLESRLFSAVRDWLAKEWPFKKVAFPGRDIDWEAWGKIPDEKR
jgi:hypothetical protein